MGPQSCRLSCSSAPPWVGLLNTAPLWLICGVIIVIAIAANLLVTSVCVRATGMSWRDSLAIGVLVNTRVLVELVILNVGLDLHILSPMLFFHDRDHGLCHDPNDCSAD